jgi:hypothetical protein
VTRHVATLPVGDPRCPGCAEHFARSLVEDAERDRQLVADWDSTLPPLDPDPLTVDDEPRLWTCPICRVTEPLPWTGTFVHRCAEPWQYGGALANRRYPEYLCPNCVTPWKCNGPHIPEPAIPPEAWRACIRDSGAPSGGAVVWAFAAVLVAVLLVVLVWRMNR